MPFNPSLPTFGAINNANFTSPTGLADAFNAQPIAAGGLNLGAYFEATGMEAASASYPANGTLYSGRYRMIQVAPGATAANVKTGTIGYIVQGGLIGNIKAALITAAGTTAVAGVYSIPATGGGGQGGVLTVVASGGAITGVSVASSGFGYTSIPTFNLAATGTTGGAVTVQLDTSENVITSQDQVGTTGIAVRPVVFLNSITPGNYGFVQELGVATVLAGGTLTSATSAAFVNVAANGVVNTTATTGSPIGATIGVAIDLPYPNSFFKVQLGYACALVQD